MTRAIRGLVCLAILLGAIMRGAPIAGQRTADPALPQILAAAAKYVAAYESSFGAVIAIEHYQQSTNLADTVSNRATNGPVRRTTIGDVVLFNSGGAGWMAFRDVRMLDGKSLAPRQRPLSGVARNPTREALADAMHATAEMNAYMIGSIPRVPAIPTAALVYLREAKQTFSTFMFDGMKTIDGLRVALVTLTEQSRARVSPADDSTTSGRFWIEPESGRVARTEVSVVSPTYTYTVEVRYASQTGVDFWVPVRMFETHTATTGAGGGGTNAMGRGGASTKVYVDGLATYEGFENVERPQGLRVR